MSQCFSASYRVSQAAVSPSSVFIYLFILFIYLWLCWVFVAARGLLSSGGERGLLFIAVHGPLTAVASLGAEHGL